MKKLFTAVLTLAFFLPGLSRASDEAIFDNAFPESTSPRGNAIQLSGGMIEAASGLGMGTYAGFHARDINLARVLEIESRKIALEELAVSNPAYAKLISSREANGKAMQELQEKILAIDYELKNGKLIIENQIWFDGQFQNLQGANLRHTPLTPEEIKEGTFLRDDLSRKFELVHKDLLASTAAAEEAEKILQQNSKTIMENIRRKSFGRSEGLLLKRAGLKWVGTGVLALGGIYFTLDGISRVISITDFRDPGYFPALTFGVTKLKQILEPNE